MDQALIFLWKHSWHEAHELQSVADFIRTNLATVKPSQIAIWEACGMIIVYASSRAVNTTGAYTYKMY